MKTWLFTWNPKRWLWDDKYHGYLEMKHQISQVGRSFATWSCGMNKSIKAGDRIFLIRLGVEPRGIIASGYAATDVFEGPHWDRERADIGDKCRRIFIEFDRIFDPENDIIVPIDLLKIRFPSVCWSSQSSGIMIPEEVASEIEEIWQSLDIKDVTECIKYCRYYHGEETCPERLKLLPSGEMLWFYEMKWVQFIFNGDCLKLDVDEYVAYGMSDFSSEDGVPISLKALLFNRYYKGVYLEIGGVSFRRWYKTTYLQQ